MSAKPKPPKNKRSRCGATGKVCFKSFDDALSRAADIFDSGKSRASRFGAYQCINCGMYHLTSK